MLQYRGEELRGPRRVPGPDQGRNLLDRAPCREDHGVPSPVVEPVIGHERDG